MKIFNKLFKPKKELFGDNYDALWRAYCKDKPSSIEEYNKITDRPEDAIQYILTFYHKDAAEPVKYGALKKFSEYLYKIDDSEYHY